MGRMIHPTVVIGAEPFKFTGPANEPVPSVVGVNLGDDVWIGAGAVIESGVDAPTVLWHGCRIGPLVYVGHDTRIGERVRIAAGARIGGRVVIGENAYIGLGAMIHQRVTIGAGAVVGMGAVVLHDVAPGAIVVGNPARFLRMAP